MKEQKIDEFKDIRPYRDDEVPAALEELFKNWMFRPIFWFAIKSMQSDSGLSGIINTNKSVKEMKSARTIDEFQSALAGPVNGLINRKTEGLFYSGLDNVSKEKNYLFISNHRDIVMDSMLMNYILKTNGFRTSASAIGDNLVKISEVNCLMRLNKSFIVKRGLKKFSEVKNALMKQSLFISDYLQNYGSIWIAQAEGRAKDGNDRTEESVIKMLGLAKKRAGKSLEETLNEMHILPVSISYEYDPLDVNKSAELFHKKNNGKYEKSRFEDFRSMKSGIFGYNGKVHVTFGKEITGFASWQNLAVEIDRQIISNYHLWHSNYFALRLLENSGALPQGDNEEKFFERYKKVSAHLKPFFLGMYANPVVNKDKYI